MVPRDECATDTSRIVGRLCRQLLAITRPNAEVEATDLRVGDQTQNLSPTAAGLSEASLLCPKTPEKLRGASDRIDKAPPKVDG